jgi:hypothetical protein
MYFPRIGINVNGCVIHVPQRITIECRKSDTLWMLASAGLSIGLSIISPHGEDIDRAIDAINNYLKYYTRDIRGMKSIIDYDAMEVRPRMVEFSEQVYPGLIENIIRIFPLPVNILDDLVIIKHITGTNFPDYYNKVINVNPLPNFGLFPKH